MPVTPESLVRHELVGLSVRVSAAANPDLLDVAGEVVTETTKTLGIESGASATERRTQSGEREASASSDSDATAEGGRVYHVPKDGTTFAFRLPSGDVVSVEGSRLVDRPARRTENTGENKWR